MQTVIAYQDQLGLSLQPSGSHLDFPSLLCARRDGSILVAGSDKIARYRPSPGPGQPRTDEWVPDLPALLAPAQAAPLLHSQVFARVELRDASVLVADRLSNRIFRLQDGVVTIFAGNGVAGTHLNPASVLESEIGLPVGMVQMPDGSVLVICAGHPFPSHNARVLRIRDGVATVFAGADPGAEYSISKHDHPELRYQWPRSLAVLPDGSVALEFGPRLLRLAKGAITLIYGRSNPAFPPDPDYYFTNHSTPDELFRDIGAHDNLGIRGLAALDDGSLVIDFIHQGVMLFSPRDPWQLELQELVAQGKEALKSGQVGKFWEVEHRLEDMGSSSHSTLRTVNRGAQDSASSSSSSVAKP